MPFEEYCHTTVKSVTNGAFEIQNFKFKQIFFQKQSFNQEKVKIKKQKQATFYPAGWTFRTCHDYDHK